MAVPPKTLVDGDIILRTDGREYRGGVLYDVGFETPGRFAQTLGATTIPLAAVQRSATNDSQCI